MMEKKRCENIIFYHPKRQTNRAYIPEHPNRAYIPEQREFVLGSEIGGRPHVGCDRCMPTMESKKMPWRRDKSAWRTRQPWTQQVYSSIFLTTVLYRLFDSDKTRSELSPVHCRMQWHPQRYYPAQILIRNAQASTKQEVYYKYDGHIGSAEETVHSLFCRMRQSCDIHRWCNCKNSGGTGDYSVKKEEVVTTLFASPCCDHGHIFKCERSWNTGKYDSDAGRHI